MATVGDRGGLLGGAEEAEREGREVVGVAEVGGVLAGGSGCCAASVHTSSNSSSALATARGLGIATRDRRGAAQSSASLRGELKWRRNATPSRELQLASAPLEEGGVWRAGGGRRVWRRWTSGQWWTWPAVGSGHRQTVAELDWAASQSA